MAVLLSYVLRDVENQIVATNMTEHVVVLSQKTFNGLAVNTFSAR